MWEVPATGDAVVSHYEEEDEIVPTPIAAAGGGEPPRGPDVRIKPLTPADMADFERMKKALGALETGRFDAYQAEARRTAGKLGEDPKSIAVLALGVAGEAGEVADLIKKHVGHGHVLDREKLVKELGDVLWYVAMLADVIGFKLSNIARMNVEKLRARYPDGFDPERSKNRGDGT